MTTIDENKLPLESTPLISWYVRYVTARNTGKSVNVLASSIKWLISNVDGLQAALDAKATKATKVSSLAFAKSTGNIDGSGIEAKTITLASQLDTSFCGFYNVNGEVYTEEFGFLYSVIAQDDTIIGESPSGTTTRATQIIYSDRGVYSRVYISGSWGAGRFMGASTFSQSKTRVELEEMITAQQLQPGYIYKYYDHENDQALLLEASTNNTFYSEGVRLGLVPRHYIAGSFNGHTWLGVFHAGLTPNFGDYCVYCGRVWRNTSGNLGAVSGFDLDSNWTLEPVLYGDFYDSMFFGVEYDFELNYISYQWNSDNKLGENYADVSDGFKVEYNDWNINADGKCLFVNNELLRFYNTRIDTSDINFVQNNKGRGVVSDCYIFGTFSNNTLQSEGTEISFTNPSLSIISNNLINGVLKGSIKEFKYNTIINSTINTTITSVTYSEFKNSSITSCVNTKIEYSTFLNCVFSNKTFTGKLIHSHLSVSDETTETYLVDTQIRDDLKPKITDKISLGDSTHRIKESHLLELKIYNSTDPTKYISLKTDKDGNAYFDGNLYATGSNAAYGLGTSTGTGAINYVYDSSSLGGTFDDGDLTETFNAFTINDINHRFINHNHDAQYAVIDGDSTQDFYAQKLYAGTLYEGGVLVSNKYEAKIAAGTTSQYYRGDKSWQNLTTDVVTEGTLKFVHYPTLSEGKYLRDDGSWAEVSAGGGSSAANVYLNNADSDVSGYKTLSYTNDGSTSTFSYTQTGVGEHLLQTFLFSAGVATTVIDAGGWVFNHYSKVSSTAGNPYIRFEVFKRDLAGTEITLFTQISSTLTKTYDNRQTPSWQTGFSVATTDRLGLRIYVISGVAASVTFDVQIGDSTVSFVNTPLALRHTQLRGLNDDTGFLHISSTEKTQYGTAYTHSQIAGGTGVHISDTERTNWGTAYTHSQNTTTAVHGATTLGYNLLKITNPSAITFPRFNADNSVSSLSASDFRTAIGLAIGTNVQAYDADLASIAALTGIGLLERTDVNTWSINTNNYATTGDLSTHAGLTTTAHGLGGSAFHDSDYYYRATNPNSYVSLSDLTGVFQPYDADLNAISGLTGTGLLRKTAVNTWSLDSTLDKFNDMFTLLGSGTELDPYKIQANYAFYSLYSNAAYGLGTSGGGGGGAVVTLLTSSSLGGEFIDDTSSADTFNAYTINAINNRFANYVPTSLIGSINGVAELDENGKVLASQLPSYVDDVIEVTTYSALPATGESGKIYICQDTNMTYRWTGTGYAEISSSLALGETSSTAYRGDRGATAYADRFKWDGGSAGLDAATGRSSLGLGSAALKSDTYFALLGGSSSQAFSVSILTASSYIRAISAKFGSTGSTKIDIQDGGYIRIDSPATNDNLVLSGKNAGAVYINYGECTGGLRIYDGGTTIVASINGTGAATFSSTIQSTTAKFTTLHNGYLPYVTADGLVDSGVYYNGGNVFVGYTSNPASYKLAVNGSGFYNGNLTSSAYYIGSRQMVSNYSWGGDNTNVWLGGATNSTVTGTAGYEGNYNNAIGVDALLSNTTGYYNNAIGVSALHSNTTGYFNNAIGVSALLYNTTGYFNNAIGVSALHSNTTGSYNNAIGVDAGRYTSNGNNTSSLASIYLGYNTKALNDGDTNEIVIGHEAVGHGSNTATWGNTSITNNYFSGSVTLGSATNTFLQIGGARIVWDGTALKVVGSDGTTPVSFYATGSNAAYGLGTSGGGGLTEESDPIFTAHAAYGITSTKITNWDAAYTFVVSGGDLNADFNADILTANSFVKVGGTASQFLKADGSVDSSTYVVTTDSRLSDARPASDVYSWAKAATKPSYTYSEVGAEPAITKSTGFLKWSGSAWVWDTNTYVTGTPWTSEGYLTAATLPVASDSVAGIVSTTTQTFAGGKIFIGGITSTDLIPESSGNNYIGEDENRWTNLYCTNGDFSTSLTVGGTDVSLDGHTHNIFTGSIYFKDGYGDTFITISSNSGDIDANGIISAVSFTENNTSLALKYAAIADKFPGFGTSHSTAAYGDHTHGYWTATDATTSVKGIMTLGAAGGAATYGHNHDATYAYQNGDPDISFYTYTLIAHDIEEGGVALASKYAAIGHTHTSLTSGLSVSKSTGTIFDVLSGTTSKLNVTSSAITASVDIDARYNAISCSQLNEAGTILAEKYAAIADKFPGFGTTGTTAAYGNHDHSGVYATAGHNHDTTYAALAGSSSQSFACSTLSFANLFISALNTVPASAAEIGTEGEIRICWNGIYVCIGDDTWVKATLSTW